MITETVAVIRESFSACSAPAPVRTSPASAHGARITSPTSGKTKNSKAMAAGTASSNGTRLCQGGGSVVRAPAARLVSRSCAVQGRLQSQGWAKPALASTAWPSGERT